MSVPKSQYLIALGSNQRHYEYGRPSQIITAALHHMHETGLSVVAASKAIESRPIGPSTRTYANAAAIIDSNLPPLELLIKLKRIESHFGARRGQKWSRRVLDLDIILSSRGVFYNQSPPLYIPHISAHERDFVLRPAAKIAPDWRDPISGLTISQLLWRLNRAKPLDPKQKRH